MRQPEFGGQRWGWGFRLRWSWTLALVAAYVVVLLAQKAAEYFHHGDVLGYYFALSPEGLGHGYVWQLVTYQFMHAGWVHLILNCWAIIVFGREVERVLGARRYLALAFASGIVGGIFQVLAALAWPSHFGGEVVGASACAFGLVAAFAMMFPEQELTMLIFFVIPVRMRAHTLLLVSLVIALAGITFPWATSPMPRIWVAWLWAGFTSRKSSATRPCWGWPRKSRIIAPSRWNPPGSRRRNLMMPM